MALEKTALVKQNKKLENKIQSQAKNVEIIGASRIAMKLKLDILKLKGTSAFVLITGENGTGKELIARNLNIQEDDPSRPFIAVNCTAISPSLFESELFGHEKGAFTGAIEKKMFITFMGILEKLKKNQVLVEKFVFTIFGIRLQASL